MKFERVDDKTVRCFISNQELEDYQIDYKDFVLRSDKAREVVREIIMQASEEVGYKPPKFAFDMSIMMMPDQGLVLTFSESDPLEGNNGEKLMEYLKEMKKAFEKTGKDKKQSDEGQEEQPEAKKPEQATLPVRGIFEFGNLADVMELACVVPANLRVHSELYRMNDRYYLYVHKGAAAYQRYSRLCIQATEFSNLYGADEQKYLFLREHGECLIAECALRKLHLDKSVKSRKKS
ncbi:MAG: adaptor protein MecA [Lachnospiraceae bacterium]|nr:adaptor protein MecA [Lachnospiraceae bacterium]